MGGSDRNKNEKTALLDPMPSPGYSYRYSYSYSLLPSSSARRKTQGRRWGAIFLVALVVLSTPFLFFHFRSKSASPLALQPTGVGHFSEWSIAQKRRFLAEINADPHNAANNWILVMGNEGGDLDSMTSALLWAYHLTHNGTTPEHDGGEHGEPTRSIQAVALLQTPEDALDLRPENQLALANAKMSPGHSDLLTIDELPLSPKQLAPRLHGLALVDHPRPRSIWNEAKVVSMFDHHTDRGDAPDAYPRIIQRTASCASLVAKYMLEEREQMKTPYHVSHELLELALSAIALDSDGLTASITTETDTSTASKLFKLAPNYPSYESLHHLMKSLSKTLKTAKKDLGHLSVRDLLRRDWKGDVVHTDAESVPDIHLGFASIPYSLRDMVDHRTRSGSAKEWFDIESGWTEDIKADVSVALTSFKLKNDETGEKEKRREIVLVVRSDHRIGESQADHLFEHIVKAVESDGSIQVRRWEEQGEKEGDKLQRRQMVWTHNTPDGGRKIVRPIVENAVRSWTM
ncbi:unnamed protein product [Tilletia controversa]|uniref:DHHA2 domain-containing protein n=3 Tax=Tilletia TaxID=13289 RepID=A0A8X7MUP0_9BASI|nr:hypothetical protein CF328_g3949 [Tilletia controversa]KAE8204375.1 hypothetical protein CF335_g2678 [Tilletia laevis]KAE8259633.1 hypothetical protein A4X03_0g4041 [Tilletia caries]KAE8248108.1 hypothetical protein A4X06_0g3956 [Tilletia controversa]CAD6890758.1 unnamed protein product [Tilletia caries]